MTAVGEQPRALADRCPGLLRPHVADDGLLVRLRVPGGQTTSALLLELSRIADDFGEGSLQLTSRGNVQLRGLDVTRLPDLVARVHAAGLLPSVSHERVRNIVASPLTGLDPKRPDLRPLVRQLDRELCATPELAELPGRFLFALDDGRGDVAGLQFDLAFRADSSTWRDAANRLPSGTVLVGDDSRGFRCSTAEAVAVLIALAVRFVSRRAELSPRPWRISELGEVADLDPRITRLSSAPVPTGQTPLGTCGSAASVGVPLSLLNREQVAAVDRAAGGGPVVLTPWRGVVIPGGARHLADLTDAGLVVDDGSAWSQLTACIGAPGCAKSAISTRQVATGIAAALSTPPRLRVHVSGCERRCGAPGTRFVDLVAPTSTAEALAKIGRSW